MSATGPRWRSSSGLTLGSGIWLAALTIICFGPLSVLLRRRRPPIDEDAGISHWARLVTGICLLAILPLATPGLNLVLAFEAVQFEGGANSSVSLEYGLLLGGAAVIVGWLGAGTVLSVANAITVPGAWSRSPWRVARRGARQHH